MYYMLFLYYIYILLYLYFIIFILFYIILYYNKLSDMLFCSIIYIYYIYVHKGVYPYPNYKNYIVVPIAGKYR
jgi:hypothetical protein